MEIIVIIIWAALIYFNYGLMEVSQFNVKNALFYALILGGISTIFALLFAIKNKKKVMVLSLVFEIIVVLFSLKLESLFLNNYIYKFSNILDGFIGTFLETIVVALLKIACYVFIPLVLCFTVYWIPSWIEERFNNWDKKLNASRKKKVIQDLDARVCINNIDNEFIKEARKEQLYYFDDNLRVSNSKAPEIWLDNMEKEKYINSIIMTLTNLLEIKIDSDKKLYFPEIHSFEPLNNIDKINDLDIRYSGYLKKCKSKSLELDFLLRQRMAYYLNESKIAKIGREGEELVNSYFEQFDNFYNLSNMRYEIVDSLWNKQSIESDNIIISKYGVHVIEVKNFSVNGKYDIIVERDGRWLKRYGKSQNVEVMKSATEQNNRHIIYLNKIINESLNRSMENYIEADGIVIIANDKVNIINESNNQNIFRVSEFYPYLRKQKVVLNQEEMDKIKDILIKKNLPPLKFPIYDYTDEINNNYSKYLKFKEIASNNINIINEVVNQF